MSWGLALVVALVAGLGWWAGNGRGLQVAEEMREDIQGRVTEIARNINPELAKQLSFTLADRGTPAFEHIRQQMLSYGKDVDQRGIYSMTLRNGRILFGPENYDLDDPMASAPGTVYRYPPEQTLEVLKTGKAALVARYKDEYGTFVSAIAPIINPDDGQVIMAVGLDRLAQDWEARINQARRGPIWAALAVILAILAAALAIRRRHRSGRSGDLKLKPLIITPVALAMLVAVAFWVTYQLQSTHEETRRYMTQLMDSSSREWNRLIESQVKMLRAELDHLSRDQGLMDIWKEQNPEALQALVRQQFMNLRRELNISHLYFVKPDRSCFLRVHNPPLRGDLIDRHTMITAAQTGLDDWGVELGPLGTFTLRYVRPWKKDGQLLGYLEAGMDIRYLVHDLAEALNVNLVALVRKDYTSKETYEKGQESFGYTGQWAAYPDFVVVCQTIDEMPEELSRRLSERDEAVRTRDVFTVRNNGRILSCGFIHQPDAAGRDVAEIILLQDMTAAHYNSRNLLVLSLGLAAALFACILALLWSITAAAQRQLTDAMEAVQEQRLRLETIVDAISAPVFYKDREGRYSGCNKAFEEFFGLTREEIAGKTPWDIAPEDLAAVYHEIDMALMEGEEAGVYETEAVAADGLRHQVMLHKAPFRGGDSSISGLVCALLDITERKKAEEALRESEHRIRGLLNATSDSVFLTDLAGTIIDLNKNAAERRGKQRLELLGQSIFDFLPEQAAAKRLTAIRQVVANGSMVAYEEEREGKIYGLRLYPIFNEFGEVVQLASFSRDNTERKNLEDQLRQAMKMEAVGTLAGGVAHDFNNLIQAVKGYTELLLLDKDENHPDYSKLTAVSRAGERAARLVRQLLLFSRKAEAEHLPVDLNRQVEQATAILERTLPKMVEIELHLNNELGKVIGDSVQIEQILLNLGSNAADAMPDGGKLVIETGEVLLGDEFSRTHLNANPGRYVMLKVSDTGLGMDQDMIHQIYLPFFTTKERGKGTGLGLASVYGIVRGHGGYITCDSEPGRGTAFCIYFPVLGPGAAEVRHGERGTKNRGGTETILLVDDEEALRECNSQVLRRFGYTVLTAASGEEALALHAEGEDKIDLVLMDLSMPGMGGYNCLRELIKVNPDIKVFIASGYSDGDELKKALESGAVGYIGKPYQLTDLLGKIREVLDRTGGPHSMPYGYAKGVNQEGTLPSPV